MEPRLGSYEFLWQHHIHSLLLVSRRRATKGPSHVPKYPWGKCMGQLGTCPNRRTHKIVLVLLASQKKGETKTEPEQGNYENTLNKKQKKQSEGEGGPDRPIRCGASRFFHSRFRSSHFTARAKACDMRCEMALRRRMGGR